MSADNGICVWKSGEDEWSVSHIFMSPFEDDCLYLQKVYIWAKFTNRGDALVEAHNRAANETILEYGVFEASLPDKPCGECFVCVNERHLTPENLHVCDRCESPIYAWQTRVLTGGEQLHSSCEMLGKPGHMDKTI